MPRMVGRAAEVFRDVRASQVEMTELLHWRSNYVVLAAHCVLLSCLLSSCTKSSPKVPAKASPGNPTQSQATTSGVPPALEPTGARRPASAGNQTEVLMHNVILNERPGLQLRVRWLRGQMHPTHSGTIPSFDDPKSFVLDIQDGVVATRLSQIGALLNSGVLKDSPLQHVSLAAQGAQLKVNGTLHKGVPLPIEMISDIGTSSDGRIRMHIAKLRVLKLPVKGLMQSFHVSAGDLMGAKGASNVQVEGDDIYLNPEQLLPAPAIQGKLTKVHIGKDTGDLVCVFGEARPEVVRVKEWRNFIRLRGGTVNFGKLTMNETDLFLIDASDDAWFSFDLTRYEEQLVNGRIQMTPEAGLHIFMPDIEKIPSTAANRRINVEWMKNRNIPPPAGVAE